MLPNRELELSDTKSVGTIAPLSLTTITNEHLLHLDLLCQKFETNLVRGLKASQVKRILKENGKNKFVRPKTTFSLDFSGLIEKSASKDGKFTKSEWKRVFGQQLPNEVSVVRDGTRKGVIAKNIVVGDLIELETNDIVPADVRLIWSNKLVVDNRLITGKCYETRTHSTQEAHEDPLLSPNMIFACTRILSGDCIGIVLKTGEETVFGTLKNFATKVKIEKSRSTSRSNSVNSSSSSSEGSTSSRRDSDLNSTISNVYVNDIDSDRACISTRNRVSECYSRKCRSVSDCYANIPINSSTKSTSRKKSFDSDSVFY